MSRNVSDVYSKLPGSVAVTGATIDSSDYNDQIDDVVNALNDVAMLSGSKPFTGNQSMGSHKLTSVTDGTAAQDAATVKQVQNAVVQHSTAVAGTVDAIQVTFSPASTSLTTNEVIRWKSGGTNTITTPTLSKDAGSTNKTIKKGASAALAVGDTGASGYECEAIYNGTDWILQNPATTSSFVGGVLTTTTSMSGKAFNEAKGASVASASTCDIWTPADGNLIHITGTTGITSFGTAPQAGATRKLIFDGILTITHNATSLILNGGASNVTTAAGDRAIVYADTTANMIVTIIRASGTAITATSGITLATEQASTSGTSIDFTGIPSTAKRITIMFDGVSTNGTSDTIIQIGDSGGIETSGYLSCAGPPGTILELTNGFALRTSSAAASLLYGQVVLSLQDASNTWVEAGNLYDTSGSGKGVQVSAGMKQTSAVLESVRLTTAGGVNTFDAGSVNISYE